jgi:hypothetical protein
VATWTLTFDCGDACAQAQFWALALDYAPAAPPDGFSSWDAWAAFCDVPEDEHGDVAALEDPDGSGPRISFLRVPEPKTAKNRIHLDVRVGGGRQVPATERWPRVRARVELLRAAGATVIAEHSLNGSPDHVVMADPGGNEFCVI